MDYLKFIKIQKAGQLFYYNCPSTLNTGSSCFDFMRSDLNRVLLTSIPNTYNIIACPDIVNVTTSSTTTAITTIAPTTSSTTTLPDCRIVAFELALFLNNVDFPYDYVNQQGYLKVKVRSVGVSRFQYKLVSGTVVVTDWTPPSTSNTIIFKLNCGKYQLLARDADDIRCVISISDVSVPCLTTTSTTTLATTIAPCTPLTFEYATFVNDTEYPYDYVTQQGYIKVKITTNYTGKYQYKVMSGSTVIYDWTSVVSLKISAFKLNCATFQVLVRYAERTDCVFNATDITVPCLSITTTEAPYYPCGVFYSGIGFILYKDISNSSLAYSIAVGMLTLDETAISLMAGNIIILKSRVNTYRLFNLNTETFTTKTFLNFSGFNLTETVSGATNDLAGDLYVMTDFKVVKFNKTGDDYTFSKKIFNFSHIFYKYSIGTGTVENGAICFISNLNAIATGAFEYVNGVRKLKLLLIKADGSNFIIKNLFILNTSSTDIESINTIFILNNELYFNFSITGNTTRNIFYKVSADFDSYEIVSNTNFIINTSVSNSTQNAVCRAINYNNQIMVVNIVYNCVDMNIFNVRFNILNGSGNYSYSDDNVAYSNIIGNTISNSYTGRQNLLYIKDNISGELYQMYTDNQSECSLLPSVDICNTIFNTSSGNIYKYNVTTNISVPLAVKPSSPDIAMTNDKLWLYDSNTITEFDITLSPFTMVANKDIIIPSFTGNGLVAINNNTLVYGSYDIKSYNILTQTETDMFTLPHSGIVTGDIYYNTNSNTYFITYTSMTLPTINYIGEFTSTALLRESAITIRRSFAMFVDNNNLYIIGNNNQVHLVNTSNLTTSYVKTITRIAGEVIGATQSPECGM